MKKRYFILLFLIVIFFVSSSNFKFSKLPNTYPSMNVQYNGESFETSISGSVWGNEKGEEMSKGEDLLVLYKNTKPIEVKAGEVLKLNFSYAKKIDTLNILMAQKLDDTFVFNKIESPQNFDLITPNQKGEYIYTVHAIWDQKHGVTYFFKIAVD
ncbi:hypothetical protein ACHOLT_10040 [Desulfitobacterium sp. Sab5]|uniref:hypothetical protein n=1 Tax=Desulfitobacterium nosdiversum TaxID=3375356 RepID=UPI003CEA98A7